MGMYEAIKNFHTQFSYEPEIINDENLKHFGKFIIAGMGGSNLVAGLLKIRDPYLDIIIHKNYGLPALPHDELRKRLLVANSYSGNTEETLNSLEQALKEGLPVSAITTGGKLLELAQKHGIPYIQMPSTGIQPRSALGFNLKAVLKIMARGDFLDEAASLAKSLKPLDLEEEGKELAAKLKGRVPIIYSSGKNEGIAYAWKIKFIETGKIPAFYNTFPELNHTEMTGFDRKSPTKELSERFYFIFLKDPEDHPQIKKRMEVIEKLYRERGLSVEAVELKGENIFQKIFSSLVLADWTSYYLGESYGVETEEVPMVEEFKGLIQN